jgi:hypothetical protein
MVKKNVIKWLEEDLSGLKRVFKFKSLGKKIERHRGKVEEAWISLGKVLISWI